ncbi:MAG TPA: hypothetical protein PKA27_06135 [Fimbriimonadaceae bacterium]|nr:hypothetical protein [Fimbriimonadaceae bacterium]
MKRPSDKEIKAAIEKLKAKPAGQGQVNQPNVAKPTAAKSSKRIRKQGV